MTPRLVEPGGGGSAQQRIPAARSALMTSARSQALATVQAQRGIGAFPTASNGAIHAGGGGLSKNSTATAPGSGMSFEEKLLQLQQAGAIGAGPIKAGTNLYASRMRRGI